MMLQICLILKYLDKEIIIKEDIQQNRKMKVIKIPFQEHRISMIKKEVNL